MNYRVIFSPEAQDQLDDLDRYIAEKAGSSIADRYVDGVIEYCLSLTTFPIRGTARDDLYPGLRTTNYRRRTVVAFTVEEDTVSIVGVFHGGRDYEAALALGGPADT